MNAGRFVLTDLLTFFIPKFTTCPLCGEMDGKVFHVNKMQSGTTAPPFHPWCRGTTAPYYEDMVGVGKRFARDADGKTYTVPSDMTYAEWKQKFVDNSAECVIIDPELAASKFTVYGITEKFKIETEHTDEYWLELFEGGD